MSNEWSIARDGDSLALLQSPDGRIFRIQQLGTGDPWGNAEDNDGLVEQLALAAAEAEAQRAFADDLDAKLDAVMVYARRNDIDLKAGLDW